MPARLACLSRGGTERGARDPPATARRGRAGAGQAPGIDKDNNFQMIGIITELQMDIPHP